MQIILLQDNKKLGEKNDIIEVADSYAKNVLIPKKIALPATKQNINHLNQVLENQRLAFLRNMRDAQQTKESLENSNSIEKPFVMFSNCGENGKLFGAITNKDVSVFLKSLGYEIKKQNIELPDKIQKIGVYKCNIRLFEMVTAEIFIEVRGIQKGENL